MKITLTSAAALVLVPGFVFAQVVGGAPTPINDTNADGYFSIEEVREAFPRVNYADMHKADTNEDGRVSHNELQAAINAGAFKHHY